MARRILLLNEDLLENNRLESILKKIGFDVSTLGTEVGLTEKILGFRPELIVVAGNSAKLSAIAVGGKLKEIRAFTGSVILGFPKEGGRLSPQDLLRTRVDRILETPFDADVLIRAICELLGMDADSHVDKLKRFSMQSAATDNQFVRQDADPAEPSVIKITSRLSSAEREARFQKYVTRRQNSSPNDVDSTGRLLDHPDLDRKISDTTFKRSEVRDKWAEVKKDWDPQKLAEQDDLKKDFAKALFVREGAENDEESEEN